MREREVSPMEVVEAHLDRIDRLDENINSFLLVLREQSLIAARKAEKMILAGNYIGPLHGIPIGLKDLLHLKGIPTTAGSRILADFVTTYDAAVGERLKEAGAIIIGKLNLDELALGGTNRNPHFGPCRNPWDTTRISGGSSGGSAAAVAAGLAMATLGTDTRGSIRLPAAFCGVVGLQPTFGRVSRYGMVIARWTMDHIGPLARSVRDIAFMMNAIGGCDLRDTYASDTHASDFTTSIDQDIKGLKIGVIREIAQERTNQEIKDAVDNAINHLEGLGALIEEVSIPSLSYADAVSNIISLCETSSSQESYLRTHPNRYGNRVRERLETGSLMLATQYLKAQQARLLLIRQVKQAFKSVDALVSPTVPTVAAKLGKEGIQTIAGTPFATFLRWTNLVGVPAITVPCGFTAAGLPIGLQLIGPHYGEATLFRIAHSYESSTTWHLEKPSL